MTGSGLFIRSQFRPEGESHLPLIKGGINLARAMQCPIRDSIINSTGGGRHDGPEIEQSIWVAVQLGRLPDDLHGRKFVACPHHRCILSPVRRSATPRFDQPDRYLFHGHCVDITKAGLCGGNFNLNVSNFFFVSLVSTGIMLANAWSSQSFQCRTTILSFS